MKAVGSSTRSVHRQNVTNWSLSCVKSSGKDYFLDHTLPHFDVRGTERHMVSIMGDLHLEPAQMDLFHEARRQLLQCMSPPSNSGRLLPSARVVQLGDLGGYNNRPGSLECFQTAREYLDGFGIPWALITGNHDLEGEEFNTDLDNLTAWQESFDQPHYWQAELGPALAVGLSTTRFRSNKDSVHEVFIDDEQWCWFENVVEANSHRPIVVFTHAPPMGCNLKVVQDVHVKNRCAWLNHSSQPERFIQLVERQPHIRLWFSGHFHLCQNYADSISLVGGCAFVQTGVIGLCNRDGFRQSRMLSGDASGYQVFTVDHDTGRLRLDLQGSWEPGQVPDLVTPLEELVVEPGSGWLASSLDCRIDQGGEQVRWFAAGDNCLLALQDDLLIEYDMATRAPVGLVAFVEGREVDLVDGKGLPVQGDGGDACEVWLKDRQGQVTEVIPRNTEGGFFRIFQQNKWRLKQERLAAMTQEVAIA